MTSDRKNRSPVIRQRNPMSTLSARDLDVLRAVYKFRALKQSQIQTLFFPSAQTAQRRLAKLFDNGFLARRFFTVGLGEGRSPTIYLIDRNGVDALRTHLGLEEITFNRNSHRSITEGGLKHLIETNEVMVAVTKACELFGFQLEEWLTENEVKASYEHVRVKNVTSGSSEPLPIVPDSVFSFLLPQGRNRCFLELDRGTMTVERFKNKIRAYIAYHESGMYQTRYASSAMRVLTIISTPFSGEKRLRNLKAATEAAGGQYRYWFALLSSITPETVFAEPIWHVAGENIPRTLLPVEYLRQ